MNAKIDKTMKMLGKYYIPLILAVFSVVSFLFGASSIYQKNLNIREGQLADETIRANKTVENKEETEEKRRLAEEAVVPEYTFNANKAADQQDLINRLFGLVNEVNAEAKKKYDEAKQNAKDKEVVTEPSIEEKMAMLKSKLESISQDDMAFFQSFQDAFYKQLLNFSSSDLKTLQEKSLDIVEEAMARHIRQSTLESEMQRAKDQIQYLGVSSELQQAIRIIVNSSIVVNEVANEKATEQLRRNARENVQPVMIYQGEIIVRESEQIDAKAMKKIKLLGLNQQTTSIIPMISLACLIVLQLFLLMILLKPQSNQAKMKRDVTFYTLSMTIAIVLMKLLQILQNDTFDYIALLFPVAFVPLMLIIFISRRTGMLASIFQGIFAIFIFYDLAGTTALLSIAMNYAFNGVMATFLDKKRIGYQLKQASLLLIIVPTVFTAILLTYQGLNFFDSRTLTSILCSVLGGSFAFLLSIGLHPYVELLVTDDSVIVLNELSNPNHPLLKRLLQEAPGTYHHSMMVASLSANAVAEIGGRTLLTRVACYYHDIGKIKHANFFVENLPTGAENPHKFLLPGDSKEIIFSHVTEGVKILKKEQMPQFVIDVCQQHHGTTLMRYFYVKAEERDPNVKEESYRYPGPKPQSREAGVVNIADSAEAAVRAMDNPTNEKIKEFLHDLIKSRLEDGQLNETGLTLNELEKVEKSLYDGLCSSFHSRIKYPKMKSEAERMKQEQEERGL